MINRSKEKCEYTGESGTHEILRRITWEENFSVDIHQKEGEKGGERERQTSFEGLKG